MILRPRSALPVAAVGPALALVTMLAACAATSVPPSPSASTSASAPASPSASGNPNRTVAVTDDTWTDAVNPAAIPLGDDKVVTTPEVGHLDSCQTSFPSTGGATAGGSWLDTAAGTWNSVTKPVVEGAVHFTTTTYAVKDVGTTRVITTSDLPRGEPTGTFPIAPSDPAYRYDHNPNSIVGQNLTYTIPLHPAPASSPSCTSLGPIGVMDDGVVLLNALDAEGRDAAAHELLDSCDGHPMMAGMYHYHVVSPCIMPTTPDSATLVGYAIDGYGIYVERNEAGNLPTDADLDACHGRTSEVLFDGAMVDMYHYDATLEYPYTVGCYHGTPAATAPMP